MNTTNTTKNIVNSTSNSKSKSKTTKSKKSTKNVDNRFVNFENEKIDDSIIRILHNLIMSNDTNNSSSNRSKSLRSQLRKKQFRHALRTKSFRVDREKYEHDKKIVCHIDNEYIVDESNKRDFIDYVEMRFEKIESKKS